MMHRTHAIAVAATVMLLAVPATAVEGQSEPTEPPLGPPVVYEDPAGDVPAGVPDLISCGVSEPWDSLIRFELEFAAEPALSYDPEIMSTDELWVAVTTEPDLAFPDDVEYILIVHGATLADTIDSGAALYDATATEGNEVFWGVVDVEVDGPTLALTIDRKLLGDPDTLAFYAWAGTDDADEAENCPDEDAGPGEYTLTGT